MIELRNQTVIVDKAIKVNVTVRKCHTAASIIQLSCIKMPQVALWSIFC